MNISYLRSVKGQAHTWLTILFLPRLPNSSHRWGYYIVHSGYNIRLFFHRVDHIKHSCRLPLLPARGSAKDHRIGLATVCKGRNNPSG